jgi:hypothetical protein
MKRTLQPRYATHLVRSRGICGRRSGANSAKTEPAMKTSSSAIAEATGVRAAAWGERTGGVNWGPSAAGGLVPQPDGIIHNPPGGRQRRRCGHSKRRAGRTIQPVGEPRATGLAVVVRGPRCRLVARPTTGKPPGTEIPTVTAYKRTSRPTLVTCWKSTTMDRDVVEISKRTAGELRFIPFVVRYYNLGRGLEIFEREKRRTSRRPVCLRLGWEIRHSLASSELGCSAAVAEGDRLPKQ